MVDVSPVPSCTGTTSGAQRRCTTITTLEKPWTRICTRGSRRRAPGHEGLCGLRGGGDVDGDWRQAYRGLPRSPYDGRPSQEPSTRTTQRSATEMTFWPKATTSS
eukprot:1024379-Pyramimonas_sp.AAC.1